MSNDNQLLFIAIMIIVIPIAMFALGWALGCSYTARMLGKNK